MRDSELSTRAAGLAERPRRAARDVRRDCADVVRGGKGADTFRFADGDFSAGPRTDVILDFGRSDVIDLSGVDAIDGSGDDAFTFIGDDAFSETAGELRYQANADGVTIEGDTDGDGEADFSIEVLGVASLQAADFLL